jgi:DNA-binding transcriptional ArsR family regulator
VSHDTNKWAQDQTVGGVGPKATLVCIASFADEEHSCYPGQAKIAAITEQSERAVRRHIAALEDAGYLCRVVRMAEQGRGRTSDRFYLHVGDCRRCDQPAKLSGRSTPTNRTPATDQPDTSDRPTGQAFAGELPENRQRTTSSRVKRLPSIFPEQFLLTTAMKDWAKQEAPNVDLVLHTKMFARYWREGEGAGKKKTNWEATWKNWMLRESARSPRATPTTRAANGYVQTPGADAVMAPAEYDAWMDELDAERAKG